MGLCSEVSLSLLTFQTRCLVWMGVHFLENCQKICPSNQSRVIFLNILRQTGHKVDVGLHIVCSCSPR